jgi:O-antigen ligase
MFVLLKRIEWTAELVRGCAIVIVALALAFSAVAFYEYFSQTLLLNPKLLISNQFHTYFRVNSVFFDPNIFGRFLMLAMIGLAAVILDSKSGRLVLTCVAASAVLLAAMVMTLSQSSLLGLLTGFATLAALRWSPKLVIGAAGVAALLGAVAVIALPGHGGLSSLRSINLQSSGRASLVRGGVELFTAKPVQGWGSGSFSVAYQRERGAGSPAAVTASHTTPVTVAAEQGLIGLLVYLLVMFTAVRTALTRARISTARATVSAGLIALIFHSLTYAAFFEDPAAWALMALAIALPLPLTREERRSERAERRPTEIAVDGRGAAATA